MEMDELDTLKPRFEKHPENPFAADNSYEQRKIIEDFLGIKNSSTSRDNEIFVYDANQSINVDLSKAKTLLSNIELNGEGSYEYQSDYKFSLDETALKIEHESATHRIEIEDIWAAIGKEPYRPVFIFRHPTSEGDIVLLIEYLRSQHIITTHLKLALRIVVFRYL